MTMNGQDSAERENHLNKLRNDPIYKERHIRVLALQRIVEGGECYPYSAENLAEALREMPDDKILVMSNRLKAGRMMELGYDLGAIVTSYWTEMAVYLSTKEIENALNS